MGSIGTNLQRCSGAHEGDEAEPREQQTPVGEDGHDEEEGSHRPDELADQIKLLGGDRLDLVDLFGKECGQLSGGVLLLIEEAHLLPHERGHTARTQLGGEGGAGEAVEEASEGEGRNLPRSWDRTADRQLQQRANSRWDL